MMIAIDGYEANEESRVGIGRYAFEILSGIHRLRQHGYGNMEFRIYLPDTPRGHMPAETAWWTYRVAAPKKLWTFVGFPLALMRDTPRADVVFSPTHYIPRFVPMPRAMSIMDLSYLKFPELFRPEDLHKLTEWTKYSAKHARAIFTISGHSRDDIIGTYGVKAGSVHVTYPGLTVQTSAPMQQLSSTYGFSRHYILAVGTLQPRKNYERLIEAFSVFLKKNRQNFGSVDLVIVGKKGWLYEGILEAPAKFGIAGRVKFLDFVPDAHLPSLYKYALCFALPSLYEGFGLPVLEAMAQGCPVVVSGTSSLPEIAGKAGIYVNPEDTESIAKGLLDAVRQRNLMQGRQRVKKGLEQVKKFTWDTAASQTLDVLGDLVGGVRENGDTE